MRKKISAIIGAVMLLGALSACGETSGSETPGSYYPEEHYTFYQELPGGEKVLCVWAKSGYGGGPSCDFANRIAGGE